MDPDYVEQNLVACWPLFGLLITTPDLVLRVERDEDIVRFSQIGLTEIYGVSDPAAAPGYAFSWAFHSSAQDIAKFRWGRRATLTPKDWSLNFAVLNPTGDLVGSADLRGRNFAKTRSIETSSYVLHKFQRQGLGTQIRQAICHYGFAYLGTTVMTSGWQLSNLASQRVSEKLGYQVVKKIRCIGGPHGKLQAGVRAELRTQDFTPTIPIEVSGHTKEVMRMLV